jgi:uncharacterized C2H2 Zn-finger protein
MQSSSSNRYKCNICDIIFINSKELIKHQMIVHVSKMFQCQSCNKVFDNKKEFEKHATEIHKNKPSNGNISSRKQVRIEKIDDMESMLLKRITEQEKARKRTRGPYRKSSS